MSMVAGWQGKILPSITTTAGDYRQKIREAEELGIGEVAFFPTTLDQKQRQEAYRILQESKIKDIPFVHLRTDMSLQEIDFLSHFFGTRVFNLHSTKAYQWSYNFTKFPHKIYLENAFCPFQEDEIKKLAGTCLDFTHLEDSRLREPLVYQNEIRIIETYPCGCAHISAISAKPSNYQSDIKLNTYDHHDLKDLSELDYLRNYPLSYFPQIIALELENSMAEQLKAKAYIEVLLKKKSATSLSRF